VIYKFLKADCVFSEVRRTTLVNIPVNEQTILNLIDRTYDTDATIRKVLYGTILPKISPRKLSMSQREFIVRKGLGDREPSVKTAARSLIAAWMHLLQPEVGVDYPKDGHATKSKVQDEVVSVLKLFDLTQDVAVDALLSVFTTEIELFNNMEFSGQFVVCIFKWLSDNPLLEPYWTSLTAETAFLARVFVEHCKATQDETRLEATLPVVTCVAFGIEKSYKSLGDMRSEDASKIDEAEWIRREDIIFDKEFVIAELLKLAVHLDYSDEIGRRKMFQLVREWVSSFTSNTFLTLS
jgi:condensin complex subunit 3